MEEPVVELLCEEEDFSVWRAEDLDGEMTYHLELGPVTVHFLSEDWDRFVRLIGKVEQSV